MSRQIEDWDGLRTELERMRVMLDEMKMRDWQKLLSNRLEEALSSRNATERMMIDSDAKIRTGAFSLVAGHWGPLSEQEDLYFKVFRTDPDGDVRLSGLQCLARLYQDTLDRALAAEVAGVIRDETEPIALRRGAYSSLLMIMGVRWPAGLTKLLWRGSEDDLPKELDWDLVDRCLINKPRISHFQD
jgi:hypothetical protein